MTPARIAVCFAGVWLGGCAGRLPLIGLDGEGRAVEARVSDAQYIERMAEALGRIEESLLPALDDNRDGDQWRLTSVSVGLGAKAQAGIGPFKVGIKPRMSVTFTRGTPPQPREER